MAKLLACVKLVADLENVVPSDWQVSENGREIPMENVGRIMNVCDANALELALRLKESGRLRAPQLTVLTVGEETTQKMLRTARAIGADRCVRIPSARESGYAPDRTARLLCDAISRMGGFDLLFFGTSAGEYDMGQTGILVARLLGCPCIQDAVGVEGLETGQIRVTHMTEQGVAQSVTAGPAVLTVATPPGISLRSPTLKAMLAAADTSEELLEIRETSPAGEGKRLMCLKIPREVKTCTFLNPEAPGEAVMTICSIRAQGGEGP